MREPEPHSVITQVALTQDQLKLILANQELFLSIYQQQMMLMIQKQAETNELLIALIQAMGDGGDEECEPVTGTYMDGSPIR